MCSSDLRITVTLTDVDVVGTDDFLVQLGDSSCSTFKTSGYSSAGNIPTILATNSTAGFIMTHGGAGTFNGSMTIYLTNPDPTFVQYTESYAVADYAFNYISSGGGVLAFKVKTSPAVLPEGNRELGSHFCAVDTSIPK